MDNAFPEQTEALVATPHYHAPTLGEHARRVEWLEDCLKALELGREQRLATLREVDGKAFAVGR